MAGPANTPHARPGGLATGLDLIRMRQAACLPHLCPLLAKADLRQREERGHEGPYHRQVESYLEQPGAAEHDRAQSVHAVRERQAGADRLEPTGADERSKSPESRICGTTNSNMSTLSREKCAIGGLSGFVSTVV